ncbi:hypothetical protein GCM10010967_08650 [Dyadobacter beijingensis]|uniref:Uncharacterized protein n=1 Tax=Dyadobacter beijingensis TaxID=365489 RepID=A0ABQ2HEU2_9BACT|nr:hypothetical protein GCM10010967_08650 [Dyadobacter beijingensis]
MELIRKITTPKGPFCVVELPKEMIGKQVEIIVFELNPEQIKIEEEK